MRRRTFLQRMLPTLAVAGASRLIAAPELHDLRQIDDLKKLFNANIGQPRLVLLLSPT